MEKLIYLIIVLPFLFLTCKKKEVEVDLSQYKASVYLNNSFWNASAVIFSIAANKTTWFALAKGNENNELHEQIGFKNIVLSNDTIFLKYSKYGLDTIPSVDFTTYILDGGVLADTYKLFEKDSLKNWLIVTKVSDDEISGQFQLTLVVDKRSNALVNPYPDTLYFTKGAFLSRRR